jgi:hypothetical protein
MYLLNCSKCSLEQLFVPHGIAYRYHLGIGEDIEARVGHGWCEVCDAPVKIHCSISSDYVSLKRQELTAKLAKAPRGLFRFFSSRALSLDEQLDIDLAKDHLEWLTKFDQLLGGRSIPARCLKCGSTAVTEFDLPEYGDESDVALPFRHPNCGGQLTIVERGRWDVRPQPPVFLTLDGRVAD